MKKVYTLFICMAFLLLGTQSFAETRLTFATGGTSGVYFPLGGAIAQVISSHSNGKFNITVQASGASGENMRLIEGKDVDIAIAQNDIAHAAFRGMPPFKERLSNARAIARLYPEYLHIVASKESKIQTINDFKDHKISVGARGSGNELNCRQIFNLFGLTYKNIKPIFLPYSETADQFKDRQVDAFVFTIGTPNPAIQDITTSREVRFIPLQGSVVDEISEKYKYLVKDAIPANTYKGQTESIPTLSVQALLIANKDMPEDDVYMLTKLLFENIPEIAKAHNKAAEITLKQAKDGVTIPLHPGALRYYKEKGLN